MLPKFPVKVDFDPADNPGTCDMWAIPAGQILMLLWRPMHLCGADWFRQALAIAKRIQQTRPRSAARLLTCFGPAIDNDHSGFAEFTHSDVVEFCGEALPYFTGADVPYVGEISGAATMKVSK